MKTDKLPTVVGIVLLVLTIACNTTGQPAAAMPSTSSESAPTQGIKDRVEPSAIISPKLTTECKAARLEASLRGAEMDAREYEHLISVWQGVDQLESSYDRLGEEQAWERIMLDQAKWIQHAVDTIPKREEAVARRDQVCGDIQLVEVVPLASDCGERQTDAIESSPTLNRKMGNLRDRLTAETLTLVEAINQKDGRSHAQHILKIAETKVEMERLVREAHWESNVQRCSMQDYFDIMWAFVKLANDDKGDLHTQLWQGEYPSGWPVGR